MAVRGVVDVGVSLGGGWWCRLYGGLGGNILCMFARLRRSHTNQQLTCCWRSRAIEALEIYANGLLMLDCHMPFASTQTHLTQNCLLLSSTFWGLVALEIEGKTSSHLDPDRQAHNTAKHDSVMLQLTLHTSTHTSTTTKAAPMWNL